MEVFLKVFRFNPTADAIPYFKRYALPWSEGLTLLAAIRQIYASMDQTLGFRNYYCGRGLCAGCRVTVDGSVKKACHVILEQEQEYLVEPLKGFPVIRDLVVDFGIKRNDCDSSRQFDLKQGSSL